MIGNATSFFPEAELCSGFLSKISVLEDVAHISRDWAIFATEGGATNCVQSHEGNVPSFTTLVFG